MSAIEQRQEIIRENLPALIKLLTGFEKDEENFKRCEQYAWYTIKNHRNLSVNSHEIKRRIEGMQEKFIFENYKIYADHLEKLCNGIINHPICINHYEIDVQWSVLDFLFNLSYNPVGALRKNIDKISLEIVEDDKDTTDPEQDYWSKVLKEDFIPMLKNETSDSELSDWSDTVSNESSNLILSKHEEQNALTEKIVVKPVCIIPGVNLEPPKKENNYINFDTTNSRQWLIQNIQNSWWINKKSDCNVYSTYDNANFAKIWTYYLSETSNNLIKFEEISTESEHNLMREIIWMFNYPKSCKFFIVNDDKKILLRKNVTIPSVSVNGLRIILKNSFIPFMEMQQTLRNFIDSVYRYCNGVSPKTYECYAASLRDILQNFYSRILEVENIIREQSSCTITTIIQIRKELDKDFQYLQSIYEIHTKIILDIQKYPAHISSSYLLAALLDCFRNSINVNTSNLCITLFLSSVHIYCNIIDTWWTEGRLDDWNNEFLIEKINQNSEEISVRPYEKSKEDGFFVLSNVSKCIREDSFLKILRDHSLEAGCTLNLLYQINKIGNLRNAYNIEGNLYETFIEDVLTSIAEFKENCADNEIENCADNADDSNASKLKFNEEENNAVNKFIAECSSVNDDFLLMAFTCNLNMNESTEIEDELSVTSTDIQNQMFQSKSLETLKLLNNTAKIILPLEEIILRSITRILRNRISFANNFVINMYKDEFKILKCLQNIRKVLLLETSDLLHFFYVKIFNDIESSKMWANPFALTVQLDDIMTSRYPEVSSLFRVEINSTFKNEKTKVDAKVMEAVDEISIYYHLRQELKYIISESCQEDYNKVFRFLLKVKWGLWTLENLHFPQAHKHRVPYAKLEIIDLYMKRLEQVRFWMIYSIQCIHFHLMTFVLHSMGRQLDKKINNCLNLTEMKSVHRSYIKTVCEYCFQTENSCDIQVGIIQLLKLVYVLKVEWSNCVRGIENCFTINDTLSDDSELGQSFEEQRNNYILSSQIKKIEETYITCHQYLAKTLNNHVYVKQNNFLSGLSAAFNTSIPY